MFHPQTEAQLLAAVREVFSEKIPFNKVLGLQVTSLAHDCPTTRFEMRRELVGNFTRGILHGGVISSVLDVTGGLTAFLSLLRKPEGASMQERIERFARIGTIDMRVDYLRPGMGQWFESKGQILRAGNKVAVTRMEIHNDAGDLIACGTGAYTVA